MKATSAQKGLRLGVWWGWDHEGRGSEEMQRKDQDIAVWKWSQGNTEKQCRAALILRFATFVIEFNLNNRLADSFVFAAWNLVFRDGKNYGRDFFFRNFAVWFLPWASSRFLSHVSPARLWPRPWNRTPPWQAWICMKATSAQKGLRLGVWWGWDHEGRGSEEMQRKDQDIAVWKWSQGNTEKQCRAALILRFATFVIEFNLNNRLADSFVFAAWNLVFRDGKNYGRDFFFRNFAVWCLPWSSSRFLSNVSPVRRWPRPCNKTPPWWTWIWGITASAQKGLRLGVWWGWGHEGKRGEEIAKDIAAWKWH